MPKLVMDKTCYVYAHINPLSSKVFYIGKGTGDRANIPKRNSTWNLYVKEYLQNKGVTYETKILHICKSDSEALTKENEEIVARLAVGELLLNKMTKQLPIEVFAHSLQSLERMPISSNMISDFVRRKRKEAKIIQPSLAKKAGVGLRFIRELEQGKRTLRIDKINQVLQLFGSCLVPFLP